MTKTRKFVIDGVVFTTTTSKVIYGDGDKLNEDHVLRYNLFSLKKKIDFFNEFMFPKLENKNLEN